MDHLTVLYSGKQSYALTGRVIAVPFAVIAKGDAGALFPARRKRKT